MTQPMSFPSGVAGLTRIPGTAALTAIVDRRTGRVPATFLNTSLTDAEVIHFNLGGADVAAADVNSRTIMPGMMLPTTLLDGQTHISTFAESGSPVLEISIGEAGA